MIRQHTDKPGKPHYTNKESVNADLELLKQVQDHINAALYTIAEFRQFRAIPITENKEMRKLNEAEFKWMESLLRTRSKIHAFEFMYEDLYTGDTMESSLRTYKEEARFLEKAYGMKYLIKELLTDAHKRAKKQFA